MAEQIVQMKLSDLKKLFKEIAAAREPTKKKWVSVKTLQSEITIGGKPITKEQIRYKVRQYEHIAEKQSNGRCLYNLEEFNKLIA